MRKKTRFKSPVLDAFVIVLCLSVAGFFCYTFWKDLNSTARRNDKEKIAVITFKNRIAQRKFDDRVVWERIDKSTPLYNGDLVRTAELAEAVITFNDGSQVDIYENTMIQVYYSEYEGVQIDVGNGNLQLESSNKGKVQLKLGDGSKISAGGGTSLSTKSGSGGSGVKTVEVRNGSAVVTGSEGTSESIAAGESLTVKSSGEISRKDVTVTSIPPELRVLNVDGEAVPVKIEWNKKNSNEPIVLQTSTRKDYSVIKEEKIITSENDSLINISEGTVYWRVFPKGKEDEATAGKIMVEAPKPLTLISPADSSLFQYRNRNPVLYFRWNGNDYANNYLLRVSSTPDMKNVVLEQTSQNPFIQVDSLGNGQWWWQVTPYYELNSIGYAGPSKIANFSVEKTDGIKPPALTVPLQDAEIFYKDILNVNFSWKSDIKANYELLISADKDFKDIISRKQTPGQRVNVTLPVPENNSQTYYWKVVRNSTELEDFSPDSQVRQFSVSKYISIPAKLLYPPEEFSVESKKVSAIRFVWKLSDEVKANENASIIQFSNTKDFNNIQLEKTVSGTTIENLNLAYGEWYWRVATKNTDGTFEYTQPNHLLVHRELVAPVITNIKDNAELVVAKNSPVVIKWSQVQGADYYNIKIFDSKNKLVEEKPEAKGSSANFVLPGNSYTVKLQAVASQTETSPIRTGPVKAVDFSVRNPDLLKAISPLPSAKIDGLTALRNPVSFSWKAGQDKPVESELVIKKRMDDGTQRIVERIKTSKYSAAIPRLTAGSYSWQVLASTAAGLPINSQEMKFTVSTVSSLGKPQLENPRKALVMDSEYLRKNRSISFEWTEVPDATEYNFVLYKKEKNGTLIPVYTEKSVKGTKVRLKKLSILDIGEFEWNVTAFSYAKDGYEERRSPTAQGTFTIKFDTPKQIQAEKSGRMYSGE